jgi:DNA-binding SARP family transcriptional activator
MEPALILYREARMATTGTKDEGRNIDGDRMDGTIVTAHGRPPSAGSVVLDIRLLGSPQIMRDGKPVSVRGRKAWALLALLLLTSQPPSRARLAGLLFADADDPLGALRWTLSQLRRALGDETQVGGDPVRLRHGPSVVVDVDAVQSAVPPGRPLPWSELPGELLEGVHFDGCAAFETWLLVERRRLSAQAQAMTREAALMALAARRSEYGVVLARQLVAQDPLDEAHQVLLVRALAAAGDRPAALSQVAACERLFARELGAVPSGQLHDAAWIGSVTERHTATRATVIAQLDAGRAAMAAGAVEAGLECVRRAAADAAAQGEGDLEVEALVALGSALIHTVRGRDEEAAAVLHQALFLADGLDLPVVVAHAHRKLATIDLMVGRRDRAEAWFASADDLAEGDDDERSAVAGWRAFNLTDMGRYSDARYHYQRSIEMARRSGNSRQVSWSESGIGRVHLLRGELDEAAAALDASVAIAREERWVAFLSYPEVLRAEVDRRRGRTAAAEEALAHAYALGAQVQDPCWQGLAARGLGLVAAHDDDVEAADRWLDDAARCAHVHTETNRWIQAFVHDGRCQLYVDLGRRETASAEAGLLLQLATRANMPEMVARAHVFRHALGQAGALDAARLAAAGLDNPEVDRLLST